MAEINDSRGIQIGDGNVQHNFFHGPAVRQDVSAGRDAYASGGDMTIHQHAPQPDDHTALKHLNAANGARRLVELSEADASLGPATRLLTAVTPEEASPALKALWVRDNDLAIALLGAIPQASAERIARAAGTPDPALKALLEATAARARCESSEEGAALGDPAGRFAKVTSPRGTDGFVQQYANGTVCWSPQAGAFAVTGEIARRHHASKGAAGAFGFPLNSPVPDSYPRTGTTCVWQVFEGPFTYGAEACTGAGTRYGAAIISTEFGIYGTWGGIGEFSENDWRGEDLLGAPVTDEHETADGACQRFQGGTVHWNSAAGTFMLRPAIRDYLDEHPSIAGRLGWPLRPETAVADSGSDCLQAFEHGRFTVEDGLVQAWLAPVAPQE